MLRQSEDQTDLGAADDEAKAERVTARSEVRPAAKQACLIISMMILIDQFNATDAQLDNVYDLYKEYMSRYPAPWMDSNVIQAKNEFKKVAKTYNGVELNEDMSRMHGTPDVNRMIWNGEGCGFYTMLRILRQHLGANYKQLDFFCERYHEFNKLYENGEQVDIHVLERELKEIYGYDIFKEREVRNWQKSRSGISVSSARPGMRSRMTQQMLSR